MAAADVEKQGTGGVAPWLITAWFTWTVLFISTLVSAFVAAAEEPHRVIFVDSLQTIPDVVRESTLLIRVRKADTRCVVP
jgi:hypothetical protein